MQKDIHFYLTYALARKIGVSDPEAEKIAWANQYTDEMTEADLHGIQTQSGILGNWGDRQIQLSVLVPFHFIPGKDSEHPWKTERNSYRSRRLLAIGARKPPFQLGIALHSFQDTFSHDGFSGWQEDLNACYPWYYVTSALPNVGHAELRVIPDVVNYVWTDPRDNRHIDNKKRAMSAAKATYDFLAKLYNGGADSTIWQDLSTELRRLFKLDYNERVDGLCILSGNPDIDYKDVNTKLEPVYKPEFIQAARRHLSKAIELFHDLPQAN